LRRGLRRSGRSRYSRLLRPADLMIRIVLSLVCAAALYASVPAPSMDAGQPAAPAPPDRGLLAVMRQDGIMVPFAAFKGDSWSTPWPANTRDAELPIDLAAIPNDWWGGAAPSALKFTAPDATLKDVKPVAPMPYPVGCASRMGVRTDYRSSQAVPPPFVFP